MDDQMNENCYVAITEVLATPTHEKKRCYKSVYFSPLLSA